MAQIDATMIDGSRLRPAAVWAKRGFAFAFIGLSFVGTYVQADGLDQWIGSSATATLAVALGWQALTSLLQFLWREQWQSIWYVGALLASVVPSVRTYGELLVPGWSNALVLSGVDFTLASGIAWVAVAVIFTLVDVIPEQILVRRSGGR